MYRHTQVGTVILLTVGLVGLILLGLLLVPPAGTDAPPAWFLLLTLAVVLATAVLFASMTVRVGDGQLIWHFGPGLIRKAVPLADIASVEPVHTSLLAGWGIHWTPRGWLYNVAGLQAVHVRLRSGKAFLLGTDEPEQLVQAIRSAQDKHRA